jgi:hypothetical protein
MRTMRLSHAAIVMPASFAGVASGDRKGVDSDDTEQRWLSSWRRFNVRWRFK